MKGAKDAGVKKHKKKKPKPEVSESKATSAEKEQNGETSTALQKALAEEEGEESQEMLKPEKVDKDAGKTEAQRKHEEIRRKRVRQRRRNWTRTQGDRTVTNFPMQLDDRLKREGVKTHKERVEELNKYLSGLSEHHDMPRIGPG